MNEQTSKKVLGEVYYSQVNESIRDIFELSTRIDERVQAIVKKQEEFDKKVDQINIIAQKIAVIEQKNTESDKENLEIDSSIEEIKSNLENVEHKVENLEKSSDRSGERVKQIVGFFVQLLWVIVAAFVLWKLHLSPPAVP